MAAQPSNKGRGGKVRKTAPRLGLPSHGKAVAQAPWSGKTVKTILAMTVFTEVRPLLRIFGLSTGYSFYSSLASLIAFIDAADQTGESFRCCLARNSFSITA